MGSSSHKFVSNESAASVQAGCNSVGSVLLAMLVVAKDDEDRVKTIRRDSDIVAQISKTAVIIE